MKDFLMDKIEEWQRLNPQFSLEEIYRNDVLYKQAQDYADKELKKLVRHYENNDKTN